MKVQVQTQELGFQPKTLTIQIETQEEYQSLIDMLSYDISIPELIYKEDEQKIEKLSLLMQEINSKL